MSEAEYVEVKDKTSNQNSVWCYFLRKKYKSKAKCKRCDSQITCAGGSTSGLRKHLAGIHKIVLTTPEAASTGATSSNTTASSGATEPGIPPQKKAKNTIDSYFPKSAPTIQMRLTRMAAVDGISLRILSKSQDVRDGLAAMHSSVPKHPDAIRKLILSHVGELRCKLSKALSRQIEKGYRLSLSLDEWSSTANKRYVNVTVRATEPLSNGSNVCSLGLFRISGSATAEKCLEVMELGLKPFGIVLKKHVVSLSTDGAAAMIKLGRLSGVPIAQQCMAHAIHNAVCEVLYKSTPAPQELGAQPAAGSTEPEQGFVPNADEDDEDENDGGFSVCCGPSEEKEMCEIQLETSVNAYIQKVRRIAKKFRSSPTANELHLQKYVKQDIGKELQLVLDCRTRWNSLCNMLERFVLLGPSIQKALIDMRSDMYVFEADIEKVRDCVETLKPLVLAAEAICRREATLLSADAALGFLVEKLKEKTTSELAIKMLSSLLKRIKARRTNASSLLLVLHNPAYDFHYEFLFEIAPPSLTTLKRLAKQIVSQFFACDNDEAAENSPASSQAGSDHYAGTAEATGGEEEIDNPDQTTRMTLEDELEAAIASSTAPRSVVTSANDKEKLVDKEWSLLLNNGGRGKLLQGVYDALLTVQPTSVESERCFSAAGAIVTRFRSSLGDPMIDSLSFAKSFYTAKT
jgi:hypothetical protein